MPNCERCSTELPELCGYGRLALCPECLCKEQLEDKEVWFKKKYEKEKKDVDE